MPLSRVAVGLYCKNTSTASLAKKRLPTVDVIFQYFHNVKACGVDVSVESKKGHELIDVLKKPKKSI